MNTYSYKDAGVDVEKAARLVDRIKPLAASTRRSGTDSAIGGFAGLFDLKAAGYEDALLVSSTDGVGTKLKVAIASGQHEGVGIDLVAMCVNDIAVVGAEPLFFLDYFATGKLDNDAAETIIAGIAAGCRDAGCALVGGETAEMPGMYADGDYDLAGFAVGAVERARILKPDDVAEGDIVLGMASSGVHSNGFSLVRKLVERSGLDYSDPAPFASDLSLGEALMTPTRIYVMPCLAAARAGLVRGFCHITGGGFVENLPRVLPDHLGVSMDGSAWPIPPVFGWLAAAGPVSNDDMIRTFNCGLGMIAIVAPENAEEATAVLSSNGDAVYRVGTIMPREAMQGDAVQIRNLSFDGRQA